MEEKLNLEITKLQSIFDELIPQYENHKSAKRLKKYRNKLTRSSHLEKTIMITMVLTPYYLSRTMNKYVEEHVEKKFDIELTFDTKYRITRILNKLCTVNLNL